MIVESYPGSKAGAGVWQRIISLMPAHENYFELFLGHGSVMRRKLRAPGLNVGVDDDPEVCAWWQGRPTPPWMTILQEDALQILSSHPAMQDPNTLVNLDPPYLREVRTRLFYNREFATREEHIQLLNVIRPLRCMVMISGYWSELYEEGLIGWEHYDFNAMTRGGVRREFVWCNFNSDLPLHDTRFVGDGFRERERIKRKRSRWVSRLAAMPAAERQVIREALGVVDRASPPMTIAAAIARSDDAGLNHLQEH